MESDQSSNFTAYDIWCVELYPEVFPVVISSLIGICWTTRIPALDNTVQSSEGTNFVDDVLEARDGLHATGGYQGRCATHAEWIPNVSVTLKCNRPRGTRLQKSCWLVLVVYEET